MDITYTYTKRRRHFGRQAMFCEQGPDMCDSIAVNPLEQKLYILRNPIHQHTQNTPSLSRHDANTIRADYSSTSCNHAEGGWPKDVNLVDPEATQRYRRKVEKDDAYIHCVMSLADGMDHYVYQNNAIDMYETYYSGLSVLPPVERNSLRTVNVYRDVAGGRPVTTVNWQPDGGHSFAVTYVDWDFHRTPRAPTDAHIWDVENANGPELTLQAPSAILDLKYHPREPHTLAGALASGQVAMWDRRQGSVPSATCPLHVAHRDLARSLIFIATKSGQEFFSSGPDGACKWWDCRNLNDFTEEMIIDIVKSANDTPNMATSLGVSVLEYEPTIPTRFMVGTENGLVVCGNRKGKTALEKLPTKFEAHLGPVWSLERNPSFLKNFLTVGDWTARVWSEDCRESAVLWSPPQRYKVTAAAWSPTRLSLMLVTQANGVVSAWDLLRRQHAPVLSMVLCSDPLLQIAVHEGGTLAACGSQKGNIYMVEMSHNLTQSDKNDKVLMTAILERESKRERILEARLREIRLKMRQAEEGSITQSAGEPDYSVGDRDLQETAAEYFAQVKKEVHH